MFRPLHWAIIRSRPVSDGELCSVLFSFWYTSRPDDGRVQKPKHIVSAINLAFHHLTSCVWLHYLPLLIISNTTGMSQLKIATNVSDKSGGIIFGIEEKIFLMIGAADFSITLVPVQQITCRHILHSHNLQDVKSHLQSCTHMRQ